jgi:type II secretory ATPase GspE/PulE/Tfp pilus assembly ATPase PilB-like protein
MEAASGLQHPAPGSPFPVPSSRCSKCSATGYRGRTGIYELFTLDEDTRRLVSERSSLDVLRSAARSREMATLRDDGMAKAAAGVTTVEEVLRVTSDEDAA